MELIMKTDIEKSIPAKIEFNFDEMKAELVQKMEYYNTLVVTEDGIIDAKADKAFLNNLSKTLNDSRIKQERTYMQPFKSYKAKVDELIALMKEPITAIDKQIAAFEDKEKQDKLDGITTFYTTNIGDLMEVLPLEKILPQKWANKSMTLLAVTQEIINTIMTVRTDLKAIEGINLEYETQVKIAYLKQLSMSEAMTEKVQFEEQQRQLTEIKETRKEPVLEKVEKPSDRAVEAEILRTIDVRFFDTTREFRAEMKALTLRFNVQYGGIK